jgi:hypothetical protein
MLTRKLHLMLAKERAYSASFSGCNEHSDEDELPRRSSDLPVVRFPNLSPKPLAEADYIFSTDDRDHPILRRVRELSEKWSYQL